MYLHAIYTHQIRSFANSRDLKDKSHEIHSEALSRLNCLTKETLMTILAIYRSI
jgi:hypothetical protein